MDVFFSRKSEFRNKSKRRLFIFIFLYIMFYLESCKRRGPGGGVLPGSSAVFPGFGLVFPGSVARTGFGAVFPGSGGNARDITKNLKNMSLLSRINCARNPCTISRLNDRYKVLTVFEGLPFYGRTIYMKMFCSQNKTGVKRPFEWCGSQIYPF